VREDLAAHPAACTVAMWHHPLYSSGEHGDDRSLRDIWQALYEAGADVVLSGHDHTYERFAPQDANSKADPARGIRQFVVGTGGRGLYKWQHSDPDSEVKNNQTHGVLKMTLHDDGYDWEFIPVEGQSFTDKGSAKCH
jgi:3',5'-cyclic AMP phosphodiesterase CpdA